MSPLLLLALLAGAPGALDPSRLEGLTARSIGPAGMSGRVAAVAGVPADPDVLYVGAATGGVWRSTDFGTTWQPLFDEEGVHAVGALAISPATPDVVWVGTGEANVRNSASVGNGIYRSVDRGKTWTHLGLGQSERIHKILLDPRDPEVAFACATGPEWGESPERGVFRTTDGGRSWTHVLKVDARTGCGDLDMDPANPRHLVAGMWQFRRWPWSFTSGGPGSGLHVTWDGGATWRRMQPEDGLPVGELGRIGLAFAPSAPDVVYALVEAAESALLRSADGGRTWTSMNQGPKVAPRPFYFNEIRVDPGNPDRVYRLDYEVSVSIDRGRTFTVLPGARWAQIHGDHHALWIDPRDPSRMVLGNDGGVATSLDGGRSFRFAGNLPLAQFYHVAVDMAEPFQVYGGLQDNGSWRGPSTVWQDGGIRNHHWTMVGGGDGFETLPDPALPGQGYSLSQGGYLMRWNAVTGERRQIQPAAAPGGPRLRFNWNAALALDPFAPATVYLGSQFVHRSTDRGETWEAISPDLTTNDPAWQKADESGGLTRDASGAENFTTLIAIAPSPVEPGVLWTGSDDGRIHVTRDAGKTWTSVEKAVPGVPAHTWVADLRPSRFRAGTAFAVFDNHRRHDLAPYVARTDDFGRTWTSLGGSGSGVKGYALALEQDPVDESLLWLGTEFGLYVSVDAGASWIHLKKALPTASVMDLAIHPRDHDLVIATHGRGLFVLDDVRALRALDATTLSEPLHVYPGADAVQHWDAPAVGGFGFGAGEFEGESRAYGALLTFSLAQPGLPLVDKEAERVRKEQERKAAKPDAKAPEAPPPPRAEIRVADGSGAVVRTFRVPVHAGLNRVAWDLRRDAFRQLPRATDAPPLEKDPVGPEMPPGTYTVSISYGGHTGERPVEVRPDPRSTGTPADRTARWEAVLRVEGLLEQVIDEVWALRRTRDDVGIVQDKMRARLRDAGERDEKALAKDPLVAAGDKVKKALGALEAILWQAPEVAGLMPDVDVRSRVETARWAIHSSWAPPSPTHLAHLDAAVQALARYREEREAVFAREVAPFRAQAESAGLGLFGAR